MTERIGYIKVWAFKTWGRTRRTILWRANHAVATGVKWRLGSVLYFIVPAGYFSRMARPLRLEFAGSLYHVTSRGDHREKIYLDDEDRRTFLDLLGKEILQQHWEL